MQSHPSRYINKERIEAIRELVDKNLTIKEIAKEISCSERTVYRDLKVSGLSKLRQYRAPQIPKETVNYNLIQYLIKNNPNLTRDDIARIGGISLRTVYRAIERGDKIKYRP